MRVLSAVGHGIIDYVAVIIFALGPSITGFQGEQRTICYALAVVHLLLTLATRFPLGVLHTIPFRAHGVLELVVSIMLIALPWVAGFARGVHSRNFFLFMGLILFLVWLVTDYGTTRSKLES